MKEALHVLIDLIADLTEPENMDMDDRSTRSRRVREAHEAMEECP